jgi:proliferating cell nuclear antigen
MESVQQIETEETKTDTNVQVTSEYLFELKTVQSSAFRILVEALKEILTDANIELDENGLKIMAMDPTHTVLVHLKLNANKFEKYFCSGKITIGLSMLCLFKLIKTMNNSDTLSLYIEKDDTNRLGIRIENGEKNSVTKYKLNLMDLPEEKIDIPPASFDSVLTMPSNDFQKSCRDMSQIADNMEIKSVGNQLIFSCKGEFATQDTIIGETQTGMSFIQNSNPDEVVQGIFALKHLVLFTKCTNLCQQIELYLKNDYPLIIKYQVASLGHVKLCLAPKASNV